MTSAPRSTPVPAGPDGPSAAHGRHRARRRSAATAWRLGLATLAVVAGVLALLVPPTAAGGPVTAAGVDRPAPAPAAATGGTAVSRAGTPVTVASLDAPVAVAAPVRVRIPGIGVDSPLVDLGIDADGALEAPADFARAGWFTGGPAPGAVGPAVVAGHVDSRNGPAVFFRLGELAPGDEVLVDRADGTTARFTVRGVGRYPKAEFPTEDVYGPTPRAELRLITCGGDFDRAARSYEDNVVVSAVLS